MNKLVTLSVFVAASLLAASNNVKEEVRRAFPANVEIRRALPADQNEAEEEVVAEVESPLSHEFDISIWSGYAEYGVPFIKHAVLTVDYTATYTLSDSTSLFLNIFYLNDLGAHGDEDQSEIDVILGATFSLAHELELEIGVGYVDFAPLFNSTNDCLLLYATLSRTWELGNHELTVYAGIDAYIPLDSELDCGVVGYVGVKDVWKFAHHWTLEAMLQGNYHDGFFGYEPGFTLQAELLLRYQINESSSVYIGAFGVTGEETYGGIRLGATFTF